ncbi:MAG: NUDIX hydrolase [Ahrensia sp.]
MIVTPISTDLPVVDTPLSFEVAHRAAIAAHWNTQLADNPNLWNGPFFLFTGVQLDGGVLRGEAHPTDFATFLYHRRVNRGHDHDVTHITGTSLAITSDGVIVAMEMAGHTANAGHIYFPAGSFDPQDVIDNKLDTMFNVRREIREELGLDLTVSDFQPRWIGVSHDDTWHVAIPCHLPMTFDALNERFRSYQAEGGDDELARLVPIRSVDDAQILRPFARMLAEHVLAEMG